MRDIPVNRKIAQGAIGIATEAMNIATDGCNTCVGVACSGLSRIVGHFDCDYKLPRTDEKVAAIIQKTTEILEEYYTPNYDWGYTTTSKDYTTLAIIEACKKFFDAAPVVEQNDGDTIIVTMRGEIKVLGFNFNIVLKDGGRLVTNKNAEIRQ